MLLGIYRLNCDLFFCYLLAQTIFLRNFLLKHDHKPSQGSNCTLISAATSSIGDIIILDAQFLLDAGVPQYKSKFHICSLESDR